MGDNVTKSFLMTLFILSTSPRVILYFLAKAASLKTSPNAIALLYSVPPFGNFNLFAKSILYC